MRRKKPRPASTALTAPARALAHSRLYRLGLCLLVGREGLEDLRARTGDGYVGIDGGHFRAALSNGQLVELVGGNGGCQRLTPPPFAVRHCFPVLVVGLRDRLESDPSARRSNRAEMPASGRARRAQLSDRPRAGPPEPRPDPPRRPLNAPGSPFVFRAEVNAAAMPSTRTVAPIPSPIRLNLSLIDVAP